jgi:hypothetical protein
VINFDVDEPRRTLVIRYDGVVRAEETEKGASLVVRVIPDPHRDIGLQIMSIFHYGGDVQILTCETLAQAKEILET